MYFRRKMFEREKRTENAQSSSYNNKEV